MQRGVIFNNNSTPNFKVSKHSTYRLIAKESLASAKRCCVTIKDLKGKSLYKDTKRGSSSRVYSRRSQLVLLDNSAANVLAFSALVSNIVEASNNKAKA